MTLDADKGDNRFAVEESIRIRQGDSLSYILDIDVRQGGQVVDLTGYAVRLYATKPDGSAVIDGENVEVAEAAAGRVRYTVPPQLVDAVGRVAPCYLRITEAGNQSEWSLSTASFELDVVRGVGANLASGEYIPEIDGLLVDMDKQLSDFEQAEEARASGEEARETAEQDRAEAERLRSEAETARLSNESSRTSAEDSRAAAESSRVTAEQARAAAEAERAAEFAVFESKAQEWVPRILVEGEYDPITRKPTLTAGEFCTVYMAPSADAGDMNAYDEYMWVPDDSEAGGHFEKLGASSVDFPAATAADVAGILDGTVTQGGAGITVTAMAALKAGFDDAYAAAEHDHAIADVEGLRGELDDLDAAIGKLPVMADIPPVEVDGPSSATFASWNSGGPVESLEWSGANGAQLRVRPDGLLSLYPAGTGKLAQTGAHWSIDATRALEDVRGSATDLSYAALHALQPGCYLVPSTAANQPTSGQGDGNLMVGRAASNRVWAVLAYNTGACYMAYGYAVGESAANFKWARIDDHGMLFNRQRGTITDASFANLYAMSETPGTYLLMNNATNNPSSGNYGNVLLARSAGDRMVCVVFSDSGAVYAAKGYNGTWAWVRLDVNGTGGVLPISRGGTGATTLAGIITSLFGNTQNPASRLYVPVFGAGCAHNGFETFAQLRADMGISGSSGMSPYNSTWSMTVGSCKMCCGKVQIDSVASRGYALRQVSVPTGFFKNGFLVWLTETVDRYDQPDAGLMNYMAVNMNASTSSWQLEVTNGFGYAAVARCAWLAIGC